MSLRKIPASLSLNDAAINMATMPPRDVPSAATLPIFK
jgi:hypothetical protein